MSTPISQAVVVKRGRSFIYRFLAILILLSAVFFLGKAFFIKLYSDKLLRQGSVINLRYKISEECKIHCVPDGSEALPKGIVTHTSNLETRPKWDSWNEEKSERQMSLLAIAAGVKQKRTVNKIIKKFPVSDFVLMLFHYDGIVDEWKNFEWNSHAIHVSAVNQTKWWFAKRFLHPDIVSVYSYIFLWDEDFRVDHFSPKRYLSIVQKEGLEISQPALNPRHSVIHHASTARKQNSTVHRLFSDGPASVKLASRRIVFVGPRTCIANNTKPPCAGFVEMMAPVFSRASWRCVWHMIQNDLVLGWGLDHRFGYCAQGSRIQNVGIVDSEYISHLGIKTLGGSKALKVMRECFSDGAKYRSRWRKAVEEDKCWIDTYET